ncbi:DEAD/DEAH box helicase family protein [Thalassoglobus polymorphus]|uniref:Uncharacterized protein n=1 Tax=Thalassoglobus polymorphus TaxID=2527994 RepID=A0A517QGZ3_9PLAN|nr:AAA family ATPase [Thalassoglobus polymorphus]QDT30903.1 hypothetical protein Mal48_01320 [Thalassoglobus polymorphus]QDT30948.1 hypothetical protein Mal48_01770 [Thalassoglobus polymorphus]
MSIATVILGESGSGKTSSLRTLDPNQTLIIQPVKKPLPFRSAGWESSVRPTDDPAEIQKIIPEAYRAGKRVFVIDDFQYTMANAFMRRSGEKSFDKFTEIGRSAWDVMQAANNGPNDARVYFLWHTETTADGRTKAKTIGKMLDEKITVEGLFSIVLRCHCLDGQHFFTTTTDGSDPVKSPFDMFASPSIPNDLGHVDAAICEYYGIR